MTKELAEARADARAAQDRANRAEAALREIVETMKGAAAPGSATAVVVWALVEDVIKRHGVRHGGDQ